MHGKLFHGVVQIWLLKSVIRFGKVLQGMWSSLVSRCFCQCHSKGNLIFICLSEHFYQSHCKGNLIFICLSEHFYQCHCKGNLIFICLSEHFYQCHCKGNLIFICLSEHFYQCHSKGNLIFICLSEHFYQCHSKENLIFIYRSEQFFQCHLKRDQIWWCLLNWHLPKNVRYYIIDNVPSRRRHTICHSETPKQLVRALVWWSFEVIGMIGRLRVCMPPLPLNTNWWKGMVICI